MSTRKLSPNDFNRTLVDEAHRLQRSAQRVSGTHRLDPKTTLWIITYDAWREVMNQADYRAWIHDPRLTGRPRTLLGIPVRLTVEDAESTPQIQLVMEPLTAPVRPMRGNPWL